MLDRFIYENHLGQRFTGLENEVYLNSSELRNYSWSYDTINKRISRFYRPIRGRKIPLLVCCATDEEAVTVKNRLMEFAETDIVAKLPGKIYVGEYYTNGYITSSVKSEYLIDKRLCRIVLTLTSDDTAWYREKTYSFIKGDNSEATIGNGTDYPYDYPYDYALSLRGQKIICDSVESGAFKLLIYGPITDPAVNIGGNIYAINGSIGAGESLLIDSLTKTITLTTVSGTKINWFDKRSRESYIFNPIPAGQNIVSWVGTFGFDLTVVERRSEPKWT